MLGFRPTWLNHRLGWSSQEIRDFVDSLAFLADLVDPIQVSEPLLGDLADQPVLGTFLAANANYLVTGDKDLGGCRRFIQLLPRLIFGTSMGNEKSILCFVLAELNNCGISL